MPFLDVHGLRAGYGSVPVLHGVDISVDRGTLAVLLGLNGAGKTTTLLALGGLLGRSGGTVWVDGESLDSAPSHALVRRGIVLVPEGRRVFPDLTVAQNLRLGAWSSRRQSRQARASESRVFDLFPVLAERQRQLAGTLSGGEQQMLAIGRGLMASPRLLLIDEASLGLSPKLSAEVFAAVRRISAEGVTVLMVEQNAGVLAHADYAFVMQKGKIVFSGEGSEVMNQEALRQAYFG